MARIVAISNQKGGVGKTTTAVNLGASLAGLGHKTLIVDLDGQASASSALGFQRRDVPAGVSDVLLGAVEMAAVIQETEIDNLDLCPADPGLVGAEVALVSELGRERRLRRGLEVIRASYDWILLDCPPSLGLLTINGLTAADSVLVPLQAEYYAMEGMGDLLETVHAVREHLNPDLEREGIVVTMADMRTNLCREVLEQVRSAFGNEVFATTIPRNVRLAEAPSHGLCVLEHAPESTGAAAYRDLALELSARRGAFRVAS